MNRLYFYVLFVGLSIASEARAYSALPQPSPAQLAEWSSHIFVGEIRGVYFISTSGKKISPRQAAQQMDYLLALRSKTDNCESNQNIEISTTLPGADVIAGADVVSATDSAPVPYYLSSAKILPVIETKIRVRESLLGPVGQQEQVILLREEFPSAAYYRRNRRAKGFAEVLAMNRKEIGKRFIYFTDRVAQRGRRTHFVPTHWPSMREEMNKKAAVQKAIKEMRAKQQKQQQQNQSLQPDAVTTD